MKKARLKIENLQVSAGKKKILKNFNLTVSQGEIHALMGPNGSGKSTFGNSLMGHPAYTVTAGKVSLNNQDVLLLPTEERAKLGIFLAFQYPLAIPGIPLTTFLRHSVNSLRTARHLSPLSIKDFLALVTQYSRSLNLNPELLKRSLNEGLSGGERKKIETLQLLLLEPQFIVLDELDTGTDVDALKVIGQTIHALSEKNNPPGIIIITHYNRIFNYIKPSFVHIVKGGTIVADGNFSLVNQIEEHGYAQW